MSTVAGRRSEQIPRAFVAAALVAATLLATAAGAALGSRYAAEPGDTPSPGAQPRTGLTSGVASLPLPAGWEPLHRRSSLPGLGEATAVRGVHSEVALDIRDVEDASLLPADVEDAVGGLPQPRRRRLGARSAWRYDLPGARPTARIVALALPTTAGVVTIACGSERAAMTRAATECERAAGAVRLDGASALAPTPETAAAVALPKAVAQLNRRRTHERRRLAATRSPVLRSAAARRLARAYAVAAARLRPLAAGDALRLTAALDGLARRHRALATANLQRDAGAALRAGATIERNEPRLGSLLAAVTRSAAGR